MTKYVEIAPAIPLAANAPQTYTYHLNPDQQAAARFQGVVVPFGRQYVNGTILRVTTAPVPYRTRSISSVTPTHLTAQQVQFAEWLSRTMQGGLGYTLRLFYPPVVRRPLELVQTDKKLPAPRADVALVRALDHSPACYLEPHRTQRQEQLATLALASASRGQQVLILVPEKWLLEDMAQVLPTPDYPGQIGVLHAALTPREQRRVWELTQRGTMKIIIGTQKALFLPFQKLGLIIVEEESIATHKLWDQYPRLSNIDGAQQLTLLYGSKLLYGSSFPSLRLWSDVEKGRVTCIGDMPKKPALQVISPSLNDRRSKYLFPTELVQRIERWYQQGERIAVLYNRRGSWQSAVCRSCKQALRCPNCGVALTVHGEKEAVTTCHHCGYEAVLPKKCPTCHKAQLRLIGLGTERIEDVLQRVMPKSAWLRLDADTLKDVDTDERIRLVKKHRLIVGTQAMLPALSHVRVDRVVWLFPERSVLYPDFRSAERSVALLMRLQQLLPAKRSVTIATRQPYVLEQQLLLSPKKFFEIQLRERTRLGYPPATEAVRLSVRSSTLDQAMARAATLRGHIEERMKAAPTASVSLRGPFQSFIKKRRGKHEAHLLLLGSVPQLVPLYDGLPIDGVELDPARIL